MLQLCMSCTQKLSSDKPTGQDEIAQGGTIIMYIVRQAPHIRTTETTARIMGRVLLALLPTVAAGFILFGIRALYVILSCVVGAIIGEWGVEKLRRKPSTIHDLSAVVTGVLLGCSVPSSLPLWMGVLGGIFATAIVKELFGGIGQNFANPAVTARIFLMVSFASAMTHWPAPQGVDAVASATPLAGGEATYLQLFLGQHGGCIGEVSCAALLLGGIYLLITKTISPVTPVVYIALVFAGSWALGEDPVKAILSGGVMIAAFFMATDYTTTPVTAAGKAIFGAGLALFTVLIRVYGNYPEGVSFAILLMNILTPQIDRLTRPRVPGGERVG